MTTSQKNQQSPLKTVSKFCEDNPAFTQGGIRHINFYMKKELEEAGAIVHFGRRVLIDEEVFLNFVRNGGTRTIAGRAK